MPLLVYGAAVCPKGAEGTLYAFLMSLTEVGGIVGDLIGTWMTSTLQVDNNNFDNLWLLMLLCNFSGLLPLFLLPLVRIPQQHLPMQELDANDSLSLYEMDELSQKEEDPSNKEEEDPSKWTELSL